MILDGEVGREKPPSIRHNLCEDEHEPRLGAVPSCDAEELLVTTSAGMSMILDRVHRDRWDPVTTSARMSMILDARLDEIAKVNPVVTTSAGMSMILDGANP